MQVYSKQCPINPLEFTIFLDSNSMIIYNEVINFLYYIFHRCSKNSSTLTSVFHMTNKPTLSKRINSYPKTLGNLFTLTQCISLSLRHYSSGDIMDKLIYQIVSLTATRGAQIPSTLTITFNYNLEAKALIMLISKLL